MEPWDAFERGPYRLRVGLRPLDPADWTVAASIADLDRKAATVDASIEGDGGRAAALLLERVTAHLRTHHSDRYAVTATTVTLREDGRTWDLRGDPLATAARMVAEDWCLVTADPRPILFAGSLSAPNRWRLSEKIGRPITDVHEPVPRYESTLAKPVDRLFGGAKRAGWRWNWSIQASPELVQPWPLGPHDPAIPEGLWVRAERQTVVPLPGTDAWVFGIRTLVAPLEQVPPEVAARAAVSIAGMGEDAARYKEMATFREPLLRWLTARRSEVSSGATEE